MSNFFGTLRNSINAAMTKILSYEGIVDGNINAADLLVAEQIVLKLITPTAIDRSHGDVYPPGAPDGVIDLSDFLLIQQLILMDP